MSTEPYFRLESIAARLRTHEWVQYVAIAAPAHDAGGVASLTVLLVPSDAGVRVLRRQGKGDMVAEWRRHLRFSASSDPARIDWRLTEALPARGHEFEPLSSFRITIRTSITPLCRSV